MSHRLYDITKKKIIKTDITDDTKDKIIKNELRILTEKEIGNKKKYEEYIFKVKYLISHDDNKLPLYDITNKMFFYVKSYNIFYMIKELSFRPLNKELEVFLNKNEEFKSTKLLEIMKNYNYRVLEKLLLKFIYYETKDIGANVTYHKNPAHVKFMNIRPFLKKSSIINTALNIGIIKVKDLPLSSQKLEEIYSKIKHVFFTNNEIMSHIDHIDKHKLSSLINFYTMYGSYFLNSYLRQPDIISYDENLEKIINKMTSAIITSPELDTDKIIFRFVYSDEFLDQINIGDVYIDNSFMSTTRKPSSSAENQEFGQVLLKIHLPKKTKGVCLSIESDSVFRREKEILLAPGSKLKLISVDKDVDFYIFDKYINRNIKKKYEFKYVGHDTNTALNIAKHPKKDIPDVNLLKDEIIGHDLDEKIKYFWNMYCKDTRSFNLVLPDGSKKMFYCNFYNSVDFYQKFFYYKIENGFYIFSFDQSDTNRMDCFFEIGDNMIVNFPTRFLTMAENDKTIMYSSLICNGFGIGKIKIFPQYIPINQLSSAKSVFKERITLSRLLYNLCNNIKDEYKISNKVKVEEFMNSEVKSHKVHYNIQKYTEKKITYCELIKKILNDCPENLIYLNLSLPSDIKCIHYEFNPYSYLLLKDLIHSPPTEFMTYLHSYELTIDSDDFRARNFRRVYH